jgi:hypothetical protein
MSSVVHQKYLALHGKNANVQDPGAGGTFKLDGVTDGLAIVTATGTYTLPDEPRGTVLTIIADDTSTITVADGDGSIGSFIGTTNRAGARCTKMADLGSNKWAFELIGTSVGEAATIGIADALGLTTATNVEDALQQVMLEGYRINVPLTSFVDADGDPLAKWSAAPAPGFTIVNSEGYGIKWGANATHSVAMSSILLPHNVTDETVMTANVIASKVGATVGDAVTFLIAAFAQATGDLHDASTDFGGTTSAMTGNATSKTVQHETLVMDVPDISGQSSMTFTIKPTDGTLGTDLVVVHAVYFTFTLG